MKILHYDARLFDFTCLAHRIFSVDDLSRLHLLRPDLTPSDELNFHNESHTSFHKTFYSAVKGPFREAFQRLYYGFIRAEVSRLFDEPFVYQSLPTFRIQLPNDKAIHKEHYDSDDDHQHPLWEINFQIALTRCFATAATWIESVPGLRDFHPIELEVGEYAIFNANTCLHLNQTNTTGVCRLSLDFRVIPMSRYRPDSGGVSPSMKRRYIIGEYYAAYDR